MRAFRLLPDESLYTYRQPSGAEHHVVAFLAGHRYQEYARFETRKEALSYILRIRELQRKAVVGS